MNPAAFLPPVLDMLPEDKAVSAARPEAGTQSVKSEERCHQTRTGRKVDRMPRTGQPKKPLCPSAADQRAFSAESLAAVAPNA